MLCLKSFILLEIALGLLGASSSPDEDAQTNNDQGTSHDEQDCPDWQAARWLDWWVIRLVRSSDIASKAEFVVIEVVY